MLHRCPSKGAATGSACWSSGRTLADRISPNLSANAIKLLSWLNTAAVTFFGDLLHSHTACQYACCFQCLHEWTVGRVGTHIVVIILHVFVSHMWTSLSSPAEKKLLPVLSKATTLSGDVAVYVTGSPGMASLHARPGEMLSNRKLYNDVQRSLALVLESAYSQTSVNSDRHKLCSWMQSQGRDGRFWPVLWCGLLLWLMLPAFRGHR